MRQERRREPLTGDEPDVRDSLSRLALAFDEGDDIREIRAAPGRVGGSAPCFDPTEQRRVAVCGTGAGQTHARLSSGSRRAAKVRTVGIDSKLQPAPNRKIARGCPWSMSHPNSSGDTMPPRLKPVVTNPNTLPNDPGGANERTIISRDGIINPEKNPPMAINAINNPAASETSPTASAVIATAISPVTATRSCRWVRLPKSPPIRTPIEIISK